jgi:hypothetical protein
MFTLHKTMKAKGTKDIQMDENLTWRLPWHRVNNVSWSTKYCVMAHQKEVGLTQKVGGCGNRFNRHWLPRISYCLGVVPKLEHMLWSLNMVHFHSPINLRAHQLNSIPTTRPSSDF